MAKIARKTQKIFGGSATGTQITKFGTAQGTPVYSTDLDVLQADTSYGLGYTAAVASDKAPYLEDTNALHFIASNQIGYLLQEGIPEYDLGTNYFAKSIVKKTATYELYGSVIDNNLGNALPSQVTDSNWKYLGDLGNMGVQADWNATTGLAKILNKPTNLANYDLSNLTSTGKSTIKNLFKYDYANPVSNARSVTLHDTIHTAATSGIVCYGAGSILNGYYAYIYIDGIPYQVCGFSNVGTITNGNTSFPVAAGQTYEFYNTQNTTWNGLFIPQILA